MNFSELLLIAIVALLIFGPKRLPEVAENVGKWVARSKRFAAALKFELNHPLREEQLKENEKKAKAAEDKL